MRRSARHFLRLLGLGCMLPILPLGLGGCSVAEPPGTPLEHGQWRMATHFATPKVDGLSIEALRRQLPANTERSECRTPVIRRGQQFIEVFNLGQDACKVGGTYEPRYVSLNATIVMTAITGRGETSRLTVNATHIAERTGDCS